MHFTLTQTTLAGLSRRTITVATSVSFHQAFLIEGELFKYLGFLIIVKDNDVRQCLLYDSAEAGARLIGIEYMITPNLYESLPPDERRLWHSHVYEVKSGMLVMPNRVVPHVAWEAAEKREMEQVITLYGKVYHLWQTDKDHKVPLGEPKLMTSYTADGQLDFKKVEERDERFGTDYKKKMEARSDIPLPSIHPGKFIKLYP